MKTAVVILNWNGRHLMEKFLPVLRDNCGINTQVIVADNASTDDSVSYLQEHFPEIRIIRNKTNEGFALGYNTCLAQVDAEYFLLLNSDVEVTPGWLEPLTGYLDSHPATAAVQPKLLWYKNRNRFEYGGAAGGYIDSLGYPFCRGRVFGSLENDHGQYNSSIPVFWASGACMLIRSSVFRETGGFDPVFFAHMEEIDLCWRIRNLGYEIVCVPDSVVYHVGGATLPQNNPGKTFLNFRNNLSMLYKNLPPQKFFGVIITRLILDGVAAVKFLTEGHIGDTWAVFRAHGSFYGRIISGKLKRNRNRTSRVHPTIYKGSIVYDHYIRGRKKFTELHFKPSLNPLP